jgi:hypothetical protein
MAPIGASPASLQLFAVSAGGLVMPHVIFELQTITTTSHLARVCHGNGSDIAKTLHMDLLVKMQPFFPAHDPCFYTLTALSDPITTTTRVPSRLMH